MAYLKRPGLILSVVLMVMTLYGPSQSSYAQETDLYKEALSGLIDGFTGSAGENLWGWMMGGGHAAGISEISSELASIESTLTTIKDELETIENELESLECEFETSSIKSQAASIDNWFNLYRDFLNDMKEKNSLPPISGNQGQNLKDWAKNVLSDTSMQGALFAMTEIHQFSTDGAGTNGSIFECVRAKKLPTDSIYKPGMIDDRPYYSNYVQPILNWYLGTNTKAMIIISEAYHFLAWLDAGQPKVSSKNSIYSQVCVNEENKERFDCVQPSTIYSNQFFPFTQAEFAAGGAPYSTDQYLLHIGQDYVMAASIEQYQMAAGDPGKCTHPNISDPACGLTVGLPGHGFQVQNISYGPYSYGPSPPGTGGAWTNAPSSTFEILLDLSGWNNSNSGEIASETLCQMSLGGTQEYPICHQVDNTESPGANGGQGLYVGKKIILVNDESDNAQCRSELCESGDGSSGNNLAFFRFWCFLDGFMPAHNFEQDILDAAGLEGVKFQMPICDQLAGSNIMGVVETFGTCTEPDNAAFTLVTLEALTEMGQQGSNPRWYEMEAQCGDPVIGPLWSIFHNNANTEGSAQYHWPVFYLDQLTCSTDPGLNPVNAKNPAGALALCGNDFFIWFNQQVPPNSSATLGEVREGKAQRLGSQGGSSLHLTGEFLSTNPPNLRDVTLRVDQVLFEGAVGGKDELARRLDGTSLTGIELTPVRGAVGAQWGIFRTPYGQVPEVKARVTIKKDRGSSQYKIVLDLEVDGVTIDTPAACEERRGRGNTVALGTQLTILGAEDVTILPINPEYECRLREDQVVLAGTPKTPSCKSFLGGCSVESP